MIQRQSPLHGRLQSGGRYSPNPMLPAGRVFSSAAKRTIGSNRVPTTSRGIGEPELWPDMESQHLTMLVKISPASGESSSSFLERISVNILTEYSGWRRSWPRIPRKGFLLCSTRFVNPASDAATNWSPVWDSNPRYYCQERPAGKTSRMGSMGEGMNPCRS